MTSPTALYRRYRPDTFQNVIGQEHVTEPLMTALRKNRVNHAYLFSGPRGCGKTTSARILARCLNCEKGPTPEPCGVCPSCVELARGGSGSLDVIEIDAASHGGVDDARDLRERATFAPVRDRYKIFIIDEAHMVTSAGFNALLKIVEEPPEHIKFIFATTEPDKVIGTIRSRTHHYPFRLVPPEPLMAYLEKLCAEEHVAVEPGVLSLVVRAGGGSVRDSLSVLDQLMAGAGTGGIDYELAVALLGYTHAALLDDVVDAVSAGDSGTVFRAVDRVIQTGHDPRRFVEDLLERFRDLIIVQALPEAAQSILRGVPADQLARMRTQAQSLGSAELSRAADITNAAFNEMTGATSPRLHLELLCARLMLPGADSDNGLAARLDRLERRLSFEHGPGGTVPDSEAPPQAVPAGPAAAGPAAAAVPVDDTRPAAPVPASTEPGRGIPAPSTPAPSTPGPGAPAPSAPELSSPSPSSPAPSTPSPGSPERSIAEPQVHERPAPERQVPERPAPEPRVAGPQAQTPTPASPEPAAADVPPRTQPEPEPSAPAGAAHGGSGSVEMFRRAWPEILEALTAIKRLTWILVSQNANVAGFDGRTLTLAFANSGSVNSFSRGDHADNVRSAVQKVLGVEVQIDATTGGNGPVPAGARGAEPGPKAPADSLPGSPAPETGSVPEGRRGAAAAAAPTPSPAPAPSPVPPSPALAPPSADTAPTAPPAPSAADITWGLAPAPAGGPAAPAEGSVESQPSRVAAAGAASPEPEPEPEPTPPAAAVEPDRRGQNSRDGQTGGDGREGEEPQRPQPGPATSPRPSDDPYADIPYADDEPPADWDEPLPEDEGRRRPSGPVEPSSSRRSEAKPVETGGSEPAGRDPWAYARESSPGVPTPIRHGNAAQTRTPTACCASTCPRAARSPATPPTSRPSPSR